MKMITNELSNWDLEEEENCLPEWALPRPFQEPRHLEKITTIDRTAFGQSWRMKERMKTVSVALVLCLNVGVDPPDIVKTQPCAKMECWIDPHSLPLNKAAEAIGANLQKQYEKWQPRARYKLSLDPTVEDVKKLCTSLRRNAKDERVLFHYNGHGVPKPTVNGEIWVFNRNYTQYIPLSIYDLQHWMGAPSIYVYDCSGAGIIVELFNQFAVQHKKEYEMELAQAQQAARLIQEAQKNDPTSLESREGDLAQQFIPSPPPPCPDFESCIQLSACAADQILPMNPDLPADLFTSCLTTPIQIALRWFVLQNSSKLVPRVTLEMLDKIPGQSGDRRTMLGELNWIFTAVTDTIAWNVLPRDLFHRLFRQDLLVASLFRNYLLAERIMRSYNCTPICSPKLPPTYHHPMWQAWDLAVDMCLSQLPDILEERAQFKNSPFFAEQLTAFQVWLSFGNRPNHPPEQIPIVLQVLLSQVHRLRALDLLGRFLDLGAWAVNLALSVGIFPYVLKLLQSSARELRPLLMFIWSKILAVDGSCQIDLVRDGGHKYFLSVLSDYCMPEQHRTMAAFAMTCIVKDYPLGQQAAMQGSLIALCLEQLDVDHPLLRQWLALCLGYAWKNYEDAKWIGVRDRAQEKLFGLLQDKVPEVRAATVFALGTFIQASAESPRTDHSNTIDQEVGFALINNCCNDSSIIVRKELIVALYCLVLIFENQLIKVASQWLQENSEDPRLLEFGRGSDLPPGSHPNNQPSGSSPSSLPRKQLVPPHMSLTPPNQRPKGGLKPVGSSSCLKSTVIGNFYTVLWKTLLNLEKDAHPDVAVMAEAIVDDIITKVNEALKSKMRESRSDPTINDHPSPQEQFSMSNSVENRNQPTPTKSPSLQMRKRPSKSEGSMDLPLSQQAIRHPSDFRRGPFVEGPDTSSNIEDQAISDDMSNVSSRQPLVSTEFPEWCAKQFAQQQLTFPEESDPESKVHQEREWRARRNQNMRRLARNLPYISGEHPEETIFSQRNDAPPQHLLFHPFEPLLIVGEKETFTVWKWDSEDNYMSARAVYPNSSFTPYSSGTQSNLNVGPTRITSMQLVNPQDVALLMIACDDGSVRLWKNYRVPEEAQQPELVTAFHIFPESQGLPGGTRRTGSLLWWDQRSCQMMAGGDSRVIRLWDAFQEKRICDITTGSEYPVTSLSFNGENMICAGFADGTLRVFDKRLMPNDCKTMTFREHESPIVNATIFPYDGAKHVDIISCSEDGFVKFWEQRSPTSVKTIHTPQRVSSMAVHCEGDVFACASTQQIYLYNLDGQNAGGIRRKGWGANVNCLAYHPYKLTLAVGYSDSYINAFMPRLV